MNEAALLEDGLTYTPTQLDCIQAQFTTAQAGAFTIAEDDRGSAFLFERFSKPAVFIEVIRTAAGKIRGNHVHQNCEETLHVVSGVIELYLLCEHGKHVLTRTLQKGDVVATPKGVPHALRATEASECVVLFDTDPRNDRARVPILKF
jgi:quercetin dioxygenase-like cupin family protein